MMGLVLAAWIGGRALLWESPFPSPAALIPEGLLPMADAGPAADPAPATLAAAAASPAKRPASPSVRAGWQRGSDGPFALLASGLSAALDPDRAAAHEFLWRTAMRTRLAPKPVLAELTSGRGSESAPPPAKRGAAGQGGRWSMDAWGFWRQGSDAAPISQGRVPIYGASQVGAVLQYRIDRSNARDPRLYARAYRALVRRGESELALGASARPLPRVPVRLFGEVRVTDGAFRTETRPSAFAVTELPPLDLPLGTQLEAYAQGGWVGGTDATLFADGQASLTREVEQVAQASDNVMRFSIGAGAWGGAQEGAHRLDLGPTMRLDVTLGEVPARLSLDWRERVEGDAGPGSGAAVTLSTRF
jgi:hypothetical protein